MEQLLGQKKEECTRSQETGHLLSFNSAETLAFSSLSPVKKYMSSDASGHIGSALKRYIVSFFFPSSCCWQAATLHDGGPLRERVLDHSIILTLVCLQEEINNQQMDFCVTPSFPERDPRCPNAARYA